MICAFMHFIRFFFFLINNKSHSTTKINPWYTIVTNTIEVTRQKRNAPIIPFIVQIHWLPIDTMSPIHFENGDFLGKPIKPIQAIAYF